MFNKTIIGFFIGIFIFVSIITVLLINLYYVTPHNYLIINKNDNNSIKSNSANTIDIKVNPHSNFLINYEDIKNKYITFNKEINIIFRNFFKSQNIIYEPSNILMTNYSDIVIINNSDNILHTKLFLY